MPICAHLSENSTTHYSRSSIYFGAGGLYAIEDFDSDALNFDNASGFNLRLGYRFHPHISVEAVGERVDTFDFLITTQTKPGLT